MCLHSQHRCHLAKTPFPEACTALQSSPPSPHPPICGDQTAGPAAASLVNLQLHEAARQQGLDVPISLAGQRSRLCVQIQPSAWAAPAGLPSPTGPSVAFIFLPKNNHWLQWFSGHERGDSRESPWQPEDRKDMLSVSPVHQDRGLWALVSSSAPWKDLC